MVRRASMPRDRDNMATIIIIIIEDSLILVKQTLENVIKTESTIF